MLQTTPLTAHDPRRGARYSISFGIRRSKTLRFEEHNWVVLAGDAKVDVNCSVVAPLLSSMARRILDIYERHVILIQVGPPIYRKKEAREYPRKWELLFEKQDSLVFRVSRAHFGEFEDFFRVASSYEQWMFFFVPLERLSEKPIFDPVYLSMDTFLRPPVPWSEFLWVEGDSGSVLCFLPFSPETDKLVESLVEDGLARWATVEPG